MGDQEIIGSILFLLSLSEGYQVIKRYSVSWWLPWQRRGEDILVERRIDTVGTQ